ncbi:MAG TPA: hypothetical protein ENJ31_09665 [Anaerolineae bacterium]|nr:hypothetical protein [Anaerolineae bacterium]
MRITIRLLALSLILIVLLVPLTTLASGGPCPDDPVASQNCNKNAPPYFVVTNRSEEHLWDRPGTGCQPFILKHPNCSDCTNPADANCSSIDVNAEVCQTVLASRSAPAGDVIEMCCNCVTNPNGDWVYRVWKFDGSKCSDPGEWQRGLPPGTGVDLPAPLIIGGLAVLGVGLVGAGVLVRRRMARA